MFLESSKSQGCGVGRHPTLVTYSYSVRPSVSPETILEGMKYVPLGFRLQDDSN